MRARRVRICKLYSFFNIGARREYGIRKTSATSGIERRTFTVLKELSRPLRITLYRDILANCDTRRTRYTPAIVQKAAVFVVLTAVVMWDMTTCQQVNSHRHFDLAASNFMMCTLLGLKRK